MHAEYLGRCISGNLLWNALKWFDGKIEGLGHVWGFNEPVE